MIVIDAKDKVLGRVASVAAKQALLGESVTIVNCDTAVISGNKKNILLKYKKRLELGQPRQGPFWQRRPERFVKRVVGGMLPKKQEKGRLALGRVKCYAGFPEEFQKDPVYEDKYCVKAESLGKYLSVEEICVQMGKK